MYEFHININNNNNIITVNVIVKILNIKYGYKIRVKKTVFKSWLKSIDTAKLATSFDLKFSLRLVLNEQRLES